MTNNEQYDKLVSLWLALTGTVLDEHCAKQLGICLKEVKDHATDKQIDLFLSAIRKLLVLRLNKLD